MDHEASPTRLDRLQLDAAAVRPDDPVADAQPEPGPLALRLGGEERVEDLAAGSPGRMPGPLSATWISTPSAVGRVATVTRPPGAQASIALVTRLSTTWLILAGIARQPRQGLELSFQLDLAFRGSPADEVEGRGDPLVQVDLLQVALVEPGEVAQVLDDLLDAFGALDGAVEQATQVLERVGEVDLVGVVADLSRGARGNGRLSGAIASW